MVLSRRPSIIGLLINSSRPGAEKKFLFGLSPRANPDEDLLMKGMNNDRKNHR